MTLATMLTVFLECFPLAAPDAALEQPGHAAIGHRIYWDQTLQRTERPEKLSLRVEMPVGHDPWTVKATLQAPDGVRVLSEAALESSQWTRARAALARVHGDQSSVVVEGPVLYNEFSWTVQADQGGDRGPLTVTYSLPDGSTASATLDTGFQPPVTVAPGDYVPRPEPVRSPVHVGGIYFPGWKPGVHYGWSILDAYPERRPALGYYDESIPEVMDWQIKWAVEHGMTFFMFCWYRAFGNEGKPVEQHLDHALHDGFFNARYEALMQFAIMWENGNLAGVTGMEDLLENLFPYWVEHYFRRPNYLVIDGKPVLFIYDINRFVRDMGSEEGVMEATEAMRAAAREAGFSGLHLLAEYRGNDEAVFRRMKACGIDYSFAYCFNLPEGHTQEEYVGQMEDMHRTRFDRKDILPDVPTLSVGWAPEPWETYANYRPSPHWWLQPQGYAAQARNLRAIMERQPGESLSSKMVLLDNLNEWGEGHYIMPHREYGFGYLDAIRSVFTDAAEPHADILPEEIGLGPYDAGHRAWIESVPGMLGKEDQARD